MLKNNPPPLPVLIDNLIFLFFLTLMTRDSIKKKAFDQAVISNPPFGIVIHTASPLPSSSITDPEKQLLEPGR